MDYKSYGQLGGDDLNPLTTNSYTCTGREDDGTGLMYYRTRYYDPELEVFISQDPLGDAQRYVGGNPLSLVDPLGLYSINIITPLNHPYSDATIALKTRMNGGITRSINYVSSASMGLDMLLDQAQKTALQQIITRQETMEKQILRLG